MDDVLGARCTVRRFEKYLELINAMREAAFTPAVGTLVARNATPSHRPPEFDSYAWAEFDANGFEFGETLGDWFAFKGDLAAPGVFDPSVHLLHFDFVIKRNYLVRTWDDDYPAGPEGRFWINGKVIAAIDAFHSGSQIAEVGAVEVRIFTGRCRSSHSLTRFGVSAVHKDTEALYHRIRFLTSLIKEMESGNPDRMKLVRIVDSTVRQLDTRDMSFHNSTAFYYSVPSALTLLKTSLAQLPRLSGDDPAVSVIGYSHIDTCWLWPFDLARFKSANTTAGMLQIIGTHPYEFESAVQWKFLATSAQHLK
jgi:alpha-mannosidase